MMDENMKCFLNGIRDLKNVCTDSCNVSGTYVLSDEDLNFANEGSYRNKNNLIIEAVLLKRNEDLEFLLQIEDLNLNHENEKGETASDVAWKTKQYRCLLSLLRKDSLFPKGFSVDEIDTSVRYGNELEKFVEERVRLHDWIKEGDLEKIKSYTSENQSSAYHDIKNVDGLFRAVQHSQIDVFKHLLSVGVHFGLQKNGLEDYDDVMEKYKKMIEYSYESIPDSQ